MSEELYPLPGGDSIRPSSINAIRCLDADGKNPTRLTIEYNGNVGFMLIPFLTDSERDFTARDLRNFVNMAARLQHREPTEDAK